MNLQILLGLGMAGATMTAMFPVHAEFAGAQATITLNGALYDLVITDGIDGDELERFARLTADELTATINRYM